MKGLGNMPLGPSHKTPFSLLSRPFKDEDIEWRVQQSSKDAAKPWAIIVPYVTSRAIMDRLDKAVGPENWRDEYTHLDHGIECKLYIKINSEWIAKVDGAPLTNIESFKGGYSDALKRAGVKWSIGRYLYNTPVTFAKFINAKTATSRKIQIPPKTGKWLHWEAPWLNK